VLSLDLERNPYALWRNLDIDHVYDECAGDLRGQSAVFVEHKVRQPLSWSIRLVVFVELDGLRTRRCPQGGSRLAEAL
jgi:hypothetical protein